MIYSRQMSNHRIQREELPILTLEYAEPLSQVRLQLSHTLIVSTALFDLGQPAVRPTAHQTELESSVHHPVQSAFAYQYERSTKVVDLWQGRLG